MEAVWGVAGLQGVQGGGHSGRQVLVETRAHGDSSGAATGALRQQKKLPQDKMGLSRVCCSPKGN